MAIRTESERKRDWTVQWHRLNMVALQLLLSPATKMAIYRKRIFLFRLYGGKHSNNNVYIVKGDETVSGSL